MRLNLCIEFLVVVSLLAGFILAAYQRNVIWRNDLPLWQDVANKSPHKARVHNAIGMYYYERQRPDEAIPFFQQGLFLRPMYAFAHNNFADSVFWQRGR